MKYSEMKTIILFCYDIGEEWRDVLSEIQEESDDFTIGRYRFVKVSEIDNIQVEELKSDPYTLGCFSDWFIADNTDLSLGIIKSLQYDNKYEELGNHIIDNNYINDIQKEYARLDGYGHHFSHYDGNTLEDLYSLGYYVFRVN